jgi:eukaryotic-like serine/threonine-protein kinase
MSEKIIGRYQILQKLGEGGMGEVYKAIDKDLDRTVALKLLASHAAGDAESRQRFLREARIAAGLDHRNICAVYEAGEHEGRPFLAMSFIDGPTVRDKIAERPLRLEEALDLTMQAAEGLKYAHERGVVHRDVKCSNLMVNQEGQLKVMDFGLAHLAGQSLLTRPGTALGTAGYMAPEVAAGKPADRRSDIWSLGVVLYEMLTGRMPFKAESEQATLYAAISQEHEPLTALRAGLPLELDRIVGKALAKNPDERYQYADQFLVDLRALRKQVESGSVKLTKARLRKGRTRQVAAAAALVAVVAAGVYFGIMRSRTEAPDGTETYERIAVLPLRNLSGDPEQEHLVEGLTEALSTHLSKISALRVTAHSAARRYRNAPKPVAEIARELDVQTILEGSVAREGSRVRITAQLIEASTQRNLWADSFEHDMSSVFQLCGDIARAVASGVRVKLRPQEEQTFTGSREVNPDTYELYLRGMFHLFRGGKNGHTKGMAFLQEAVEQDPGDPHAYAGLALGYLTEAHGTEARDDSMGRAKSAALRALRLDGSLAEAWTVLATVQAYSEWDWENAFASIDHALELNPSSAGAYYHRSWFLIMFDRMEEAIRDHLSAQRLDPFNPANSGWLAELYRMDKQFDRALEEANKAIALQPAYADAHFVLGLTYLDMGRHEEGLAALRKAGEQVTWYHGEDRHGYRWAQALAYARMGREADLRKVLEELKATKPTIWAGFWLMVLHANLGEMDEAYKWMERKPHHIWIPGVRVLTWPGFDEIRKDPRFPAALRRMNLPPAGQPAARPMGPRAGAAPRLGFRLIPSQS